MNEKMTDHYPRKKRRLCLSTSKTPNRKKHVLLRSDSQESRGSTPDPKLLNVQLPLKIQRKHSPNLQQISSDESCLEIGWDNNSPSPTTILRSGKVRRNTRQKPSDICNLFNVLPKQKQSMDSSDTSLFKDEHLSTWMQENLAVSAVMQSTAKKHNTRRSATKRSLRGRKDAKDFNEQLKKMMEFSQKIDGHSTGSNGCRKSPRLSLMRCNTERSSPTLLNQSQSDSLLMMENFDELLIAEVPANKENQPNKSKPVIKTPKIPKRNQNTAGNVNKTVNLQGRRSLRSADNITCDKKPQGTLTCYMKPVLSSPSKQTTSKQTSIEMDDELDDILASQPAFNEKDDISKQADESGIKVIDLTMEDEDGEEEDSIGDECKQTTNFTKVKNNITEKDDEKRSINLAMKRKTMSTPKLFKTETGLLKTKTSGLVAFDDDDVIFDDLLLSLDDDVKCKSQETPPQKVTEDQRKLKTRSHTSPFPLNKKYKLAVARSTLNNNNNDNLKNSSESNNTDILYPTTTTAFVAVPSKKITQDPSNPPKRQCVDKSSILSTSIISDRCRQPFRPPNRDSSRLLDSHKEMSFHLDLSIIKKDNTTNNAVKDVDESIIKTETSDVRLSSTQRCSYSDIERKRKEAQTRLKQRLRRKK